MAGKAWQQLGKVWGGNRKQVDHSSPTHMKYSRDRWEVGPGCKTPKPVPRDVLSPARFCLLKGPHLLQRVRPTGNRVFKCVNLWGHFPLTTVCTIGEM